MMGPGFGTAVADRALRALLLLILGIVTVSAAIGGIVVFLVMRAWA